MVKDLKYLVLKYPVLKHAVFLLLLPMTVACANADSKSTTQKILKPLIEQQCGSELKSNKIWQASSFFWSKSQQDHAQNKICGCVSENALNDVSNKDLLMAMINESAKKKLIQNAVMNSIKGCAQEALK